MTDTDARAEYPPHVVDAWKAWAGESRSLREWELLTDEQRARFATVIGVAVGRVLDDHAADAKAKAEAVASDQWAVVEVMGHRVIIGRVRECVVADAPMLHVERPDGITQLVPPSSLFCITDVTEDVARKAHDRQALGYGLPHPLTNGIRFDGKQYTHGLPSGDPDSPWRDNPFGDDVDEDDLDDPWHSDGGDD